MDENQIAEKVIGLSIKVHSTLGPGLLESVYEKALSSELRRNNFEVAVQEPVAVNYDGIVIDEGFRADIIVNRLVILEIKSIRSIADIHLKQLLTYVRLMNLKLRILINFNEASLKSGIRRVINGLI